GRPPARPAATTPARFPPRPDKPAAHFDRFLPGQRGGEGGIRSVEQMMALVEDDPARRIWPAAGGVDHHQRMIGDYQVGLTPGPLGSLDEAFPIVRAAGIDTFAAAVGERGGPRPAEQAGEPTRT